jgi:hypothetical protein
MHQVTIHFGYDIKNKSVTGTELREVQGFVDIREPEDEAVNSTATQSSSRLVVSAEPLGGSTHVERSIRQTLEHIAVNGLHENHMKEKEGYEQLMSRLELLEVAPFFLATISCAASVSP